MKTVFVFFLILGIFLIGCHTPQVTRGRDDHRIDAAAVSTTIDMADWRYSMQQLVGQMQTSAFFVTARQGNRKTIAISDFLNESPEHLNTGFLKELLGEELINSGNFRLVDEANRGQLMNTLMKQNLGTDLFDASTIAVMGRQFGVQYFFQGKVLGQRERGHDRVRLQYLISVEVVDVSTAEIVFKKTIPVTKQLK